MAKGLKVVKGGFPSFGNRDDVVDFEVVGAMAFSAAVPISGTPAICKKAGFPASFLVRNRNRNPA